jgi:hypothetical protein
MATSQAGQIRMPFGKHKGEPLIDLPDSYLAWLIREATNMDDWLREAIEAEAKVRAEWRQRRGQYRQQQRDAGASTNLAHPAVMAWRDQWRRIIFLAHPDRGGNDELCAILNNINDLMRSA